MRKRAKGRKFSRERRERKALLQHLTSALVLHGAIRTTDAKARELRPHVEKLITRAKRGDLATRRTLSRGLPPFAVRRLLNEIAPSLRGRPGGYTRIIKLPQRKSDGAHEAILEILKQ